MANRLVEYVVKSDGEFEKSCSTLAQARRYVENMPKEKSVSDMPKIIQIIKVVSVSTVLNEYIAKPSIVLEASEVFDDVSLA
jgi:hypothetical protein